ncbi:S8 family serine peptidase [Nonomuraea sp. NPDC047897]|uniref:S8 family serine peptidase n=1 Tax=Nonomuraea sp. NPDC047897 TaxID=3364346 RepID=UPI0037112DFF
MRLGSGLAAVILAGSAGFAAVPAPAEAGPGQPTGQEAEPVRAAGDGRSGAVTLITGDRVVVTPAGHRVEPGPGRQGSFTTRRRDGHLYVYPSDALPLVARGVLDERLFDVTQLLEWGYGDAQRPDIPLIAQSEQGDVPALRSTRRLSHLGMSAVQVPKAGAARAWQDLTGGARALTTARTKLWLDGRRSFTLDRSVGQIGAPQAWQQGLTGKGVTVAVLDSGYDPGHPDLKGVVTHARDFTGGDDVRDRNGHGTHVASIVAGAGEKHRGVAPEAKLAVGKIGDRSIKESDILAGMEWAAVEVKAKVVNMSIGGPDSMETDPVEQAVGTLSERTGTLFVVAAGNDGGKNTIGSPGSAEAALTVGAVDRDDKVAGFSSRGPRVGDHAIKPDVTAPGVQITAAAAGGTAEGSHVALSGTSMATPHVAGAAAILAQRHPDWSGRRLKAALIGSAAPNGDATPYEQGAGRVDLVRALAQPVAAVTGNVWAAFPWNSTGDKSATRTLTYANSGDTPVTLDLTADGEVLELASKRLEVPARGEVSVELTIRAEGKAPGDHPGTVTARSGDTVVRVLAGAFVEPESYDLTVNAVDRNGAPTLTSGEVYNLRTGDLRLLSFDDRGVARVRLPEGEWNLYVGMFGRAGSATAHLPLTIDGADREVTLDTRQARQIRFAVDEPTAARERVMSVMLANGSWSAGSISFNVPDEQHYVFPVRQPGLRYMAKTTWHKKDAKPSPYRYDLVDHRTDGIPEDPSHTARTSELVKVEATYRAPGAPGEATAWAGPRFPGTSWMDAWTFPSPELDLPATMTHYRTPGFAWTTEVQAGGHTVLGSSEVLRRRPVKEVWNAAVTGPAFGTPAGGRDGDTLRFTADRLFTDGRAALAGTDTTATGTVSLARGDEVLATKDLTACGFGEPEKCLLRTRLPAEAATYTLTASAQRQATLSTKVESVWTFRSQRAAEPRPLPLTAVRYAPEGLDDHNRAKPGATTRIPIRVQRNPGAAEAKVRSLTLEASFDDGASWNRVRLTRSHHGWTAQLTNPAAGFVSLRATAVDGAGDRVTQTVTRAYAIG